MPGGIGFIGQFWVLSSLREQETIYLHNGICKNLVDGTVI
jgi:hypothetical protein